MIFEPRPEQNNSGFRLAAHTSSWLLPFLGALGGASGEGGRAPRGDLKNDLFWLILLYFRPSGISPIDSSRRELQNPLIKMKIGDFFNFLVIFGLPDGPGRLPDGPC